MINIPHDFVAFVPGWPRAMRFEKLAPDVWIRRWWDCKWILPHELGDAEVAKVFEIADYVFLPEPIFMFEPVATETERQVQ